MPKISKPFRVAAEGRTADNREITRAQLEDMASTYSQEKYGARIWNNHLRGILPDSLFSPLGDVLKLETRQFTDAEGAERTGLYAVISAFNGLTDMLAKGVNIFWSVEMAPNFAGSGKHYLVGLAPTDDPASLYTESLQFSGGKLMATRHLTADTLFTSALDSGSIEWEEDPKPSLADQLLERLREKFSGIGRENSEIKRAIEELAGYIALTFDQSASKIDLAELERKITALESARKADREEFDQLLACLSKTPDDSSPRPPVPGGTGAIVTNC